MIALIVHHIHVHKHILIPIEPDRITPNRITDHQGFPMTPVPKRAGSPRRTLPGLQISQARQELRWRWRFEVPPGAMLRYKVVPPGRNRGLTVG